MEILNNIEEEENLCEMCGAVCENYFARYCEKCEEDVLNDKK